MWLVKGWVPIFQLLMQSLNLLKFKIPHIVGGGVGGGRAGSQLPTFDAESKSANIPNFLYNGGDGGTQLPTFNAESKSAEITNSLYGGGTAGSQLPFFDALSKYAKIWNSQYSGVRGWRQGAGTQFSTFDAESKSAKIPNSLGGGWCLWCHLIRSPTWVQTKVFYFRPEYFPPSQSECITDSLRESAAMNYKIEIGILTG